MLREEILAHAVRLMRLWRLRYGVGFCLLLPLLFAGCLPEGDGQGAASETTPAGMSAGPAQARVIATVDFGASTLFDVTVPLDEGDSAMDALRAVAEVETAYGGGFVRSIDGTGSTSGSGTSQKGDWFYYVNGFMARTGAADYRLHDGDTVHWDFHDPGTYRAVSATAGSFPLAYVYGYAGERRSTVVAYEEPFVEEATLIASFLESAGAPEVTCVELSLLTSSQKESLNLIVIGGSSTGPVLEVYDNRARLGLFTSLQDSELRTYSAAGVEDEVYQRGTGVLQAMQSPWNPSGVGVCQNMVLLVSGTDDDGVRAAATALVEYSDQMMTWCGVVIQERGTELIPVPAR